MSYAFDLKKVTLEDFKLILLEGYLIPSQLMLRDNIDEHFKVLKEDGIKDMDDLSKATKNKTKAATYADKVGIPEDYMTVLRRAVASYLPKPRKLEDYPDITLDLLEDLKSKGMKTSRDLFESGIDLDDTIKALMAVSRLRYVSGSFATALVKAGYTSIDMIAESQADQMYDDMVKTNKTYEIYKGPIGKNDMLFIIDDAKLWKNYDMI